VRKGNSSDNVLGIGGVTTYWLPPIARHEDGCIWAPKYPHIPTCHQEVAADIIETFPCKSTPGQHRLHLAQPKPASVVIRKFSSLRLSHSCTVPFSGFLAVLFAATAIRIAKRKLLLRVSIAQPRRNFEIRLKVIVGTVAALF
jgi:hypothetical protein